MPKRYEYNGHSFIRLSEWRYDETKKWFQAKHQIRPEQFYIVADGIPEKAETKFTILSGQEIIEEATNSQAKLVARSWHIDSQSFYEMTEVMVALKEKFGVDFQALGGEVK